MIDGIFIADEYRITFGGRTFSGKCAGVTEKTKFDGLGDGKEDKMIAFSIIAACAFAHKFEGGDKGWDYQRYYVSMDGGDSWMHQPRKFRTDGDRVFLIKTLTREDIPESESGIMTLSGDLLTVTKNNAVVESTVVFRKTAT
jgi:hypothetical protein